MATGRKAFSGTSQASLISAILRDDPRTDLPGPADGASGPRPRGQTCLAKDPDDRWQTAHDVKLQLQWIAEGFSSAVLPAPAGARERPADGCRGYWLPCSASRWPPLWLSRFGPEEASQAERVARLSLLPPEKSTFIPRHDGRCARRQAALPSSR